MNLSTLFSIVPSPSKVILTILSDFTPCSFSNLIFAHLVLVYAGCCIQSIIIGRRKKIGKNMDTSPGFNVVVVVVIPRPDMKSHNQHDGIVKEKERGRPTGTTPSS
jgi:hypothetical protein